MAVELPPEVMDFLLVGRIVKRGHETGVIKYLKFKFGHGQQHEGFPVHYGPSCGPSNKEKGKAKEDLVPMDTEWLFTVFWEGREEPEEMTMEEVHQIVEEEFTSEEWLTASIARLQADGWAKEWDGLTPANVRKFIQESIAEREKELGAAAKAARAAEAKAARAAKPKAPAKPRAAGGKAAGAGTSAGAAKRKAAAKEDAPLQAATGVAAALQAKKEARKRKAAEGAAGPSPAKQRKSLLGALAPVSRAEAAEAAKAAAAAAAAAASPVRAAALRAAPAPLAPAPGAAAAAAAAAAHVETSSGTRSISDQAAAAPPASQKHKQQQQQQQQQRDSPSSQAGPSTKQQQKGKAAAAAAGASGSKGKQALLSAGKAAPSGSKGKLAHAAASPAKSRRSTASGRPIPEVLLQHEKPAMNPADSALLLEEEGKSEDVVCDDGAVTDAAWFDRVLGSDGKVYRVYNESLIVPESLCFKAKHDKRMSTWKTKPQESGDYSVEAVLAEQEDEDGQLRFMVKWKGYEADPGEGGWLEKDGMGDCRDLLREWRRKGRSDWQAASSRILQEAGLVDGADN